MKKLVLLSGALTSLWLGAYTSLDGLRQPGSIREKYTNNVLTVKNYTQNPLTVWTTGFHETDRTQINPGEEKAVITSIIDPNVLFDFLLPKTVTVTVHVASDGREFTKDISKHYTEHQAQFYRDNFALSVAELSDGRLIIREEKAVLPSWSPQQRTTEHPEGAQIHYPEK